MEADASTLARLRSAPARRPAVTAFAGVFAATLLGFLAIGAVLPILPRYVRGPVGAGDLAVGIVTGAFALTAVIGRPIGGRLADARGRRLIVVIGLVVVSVAGLLYLLPLGVGGLVLARLVLGIGDGWVFTAGAAWIIDLAPLSRRGQAIGIFGLAIWGGLTLGPLLGEAVFSLWGYHAVFALTALTPLLGALVAQRVPDAHEPLEPEDDARQPLVPRPVIAPGLALLLANIGYGTVAGFLVLHLADRGVGDGAVVFTAFAASVIVTRLVAGRLPDLVGPRASAAAAGCAEAFGLALLAMAGGMTSALVGAVVMGFGFSLLFPSLALIAVQRSGEERRGAALGGFTAFFDMGVGIGAPLAGAIAALGGYPAAFWAAAGCALLGAVVGAVATRRPVVVVP
jgi:MFS family permease